MDNGTTFKTVSYVVEIAANIISKDNKIKFVGEDDKGYVFSCNYRKATHFKNVVEASNFKFNLIKKFKIKPTYVKIRTIETKIY